MKLLIVDDEIFTVRAIQTTIDWAKTGVDQTFSAYNAAKAREILMNETIDLMICDIEMPREDAVSYTHLDVYKRQDPCCDRAGNCLSLYDR